MHEPDPDQLLDQLDEQQRVVAANPTGAMVVRAGAGTGKTRAITYRIAYGVATGAYTPLNVMAVTFTRRAATEMRTRLKQLGCGTVLARTFHSAALSQLRYFWPAVVGGPIPEIVDRKASLVYAGASRLGITLSKEQMSDVAQEIEWAAVSLVGDHEYVARVTQNGRIPPAGLDAQTMAQLIASYNQAKADRGVMDLEDVLTLTCGMLEQRPDVLRQVRRQYRYFVVDEFQDVSPLQARLLDLWLGDRRSLCVVGDAAQTIYSFTGATDRYLREFTTKYPEARVVELVRDYRSTPQIVSLANHLMTRAKTTQSVRLEAQQPSGPMVQFHTYADDEDEAAQVAKQIAQLVAQGVPLKDMAILYRINAQSVAFEEALEDAGIAYIVRDAKQFFQRSEVRKTITTLMGLVRVSPTTTELGEVMRSGVAQFGWQPEPPEGPGKVRELWDYLNALVQLADTREESKMTLVELVAELKERVDNQAAPQVDGVTLSSLHAAKGLEWEAVFLVGCSDGLLPIKQATSSAEIEEELRLAYVGVTRAKRHLSVSYARARSAGGRGNRKVSPFFSRVWPDVGRAQPKHRRATSKQETSKFLAEADPEEAETFERLREWRGAVAKQLGKPAYVVATDAALRNIAHARPKTLRMLGLLPGIGPVKLRTLGASILAVVAGGDIDEQAARAAAEWASDDVPPEPVG